jgi:hypothetical protein
LHIPIDILNIYIERSLFYPYISVSHVESCWRVAIVAAFLGACASPGFWELLLARCYCAACGVLLCSLLGAVGVLRS